MKHLLFLALLTSLLFSQDMPETVTNVCRTLINGSGKSTNGQVMQSDKTDYKIPDNAVFRFSNNQEPSSDRTLPSVSHTDIVPERFLLSQNYPNPFNPETSISFEIPDYSVVSLAIFSSEGKLIREVVNGSMQAGRYKVDFNASGLSSGIYFYRLISNGQSDTKKMMLIK